MSRISEYDGLDDSVGQLLLQGRWTRNLAMVATSKRGKKALRELGDGPTILGQLLTASSRELVRRNVSELRLSHDKPVDRGLASSGYTAAGTVLGCDVAGGIQIGVQREATCSALKPPTRATVVAGDVPASAALLRGFPRVYRRHRTASLFSLIPDEGTQLGKGPAMKAPGLRPVTDFYATADVRKILDDNRAADWCSGDDLLTQHVVTISSKAALFAPEFAQMSLCGLGTGFLQRPTQFEQASFGCLPRFLPEKGVGRCNGRLSDAKVNANYYVSRNNLRRGHRDDDVQVPCAFAFDEVCGIDGITEEALSVGRQRKANRQALCRGRETDRACVPIQTEGVQIEAGWTSNRAWAGDAATLFRQYQRTAHSFRSLDPCLDVQVAHQGRVIGLQRPVERMMQGHAVALVMLPAVRADGVEDGRELRCRFTERSRLVRRRVQAEANGALHRFSIPYTARFREVARVGCGRFAFLPWLQARGPQRGT